MFYIWKNVFTQNHLRHLKAEKKSRIDYQCIIIRIRLVREKQNWHSRDFFEPCFGVFFANLWQVSSKVLFNKSNYIFVNHVFLVHLRNSKGYEIVAQDGGQFFSFYYLRMPVNLTQYRGAVGTFNTRRSIFQRSHKTFSFLHYVNIHSFQSYSLSTLILFIYFFLFLGLNGNGHKSPWSFLSDFFF